MRQKRLGHFAYSEADDGGVNLTPLIDVVFVVLIMFILIAPMLEVDKIKLAPGAANNKTEAVSPGTLLIHVHEDNSVSINKREITLENLGPILKALYAKDTKLTPQLYQDERARFGTYQAVKNAIEEAGFSELDVILDSANH